LEHPPEKKTGPKKGCVDSPQRRRLGLTFIERRKHPRIEISNLIAYVCKDDRGKPVKEGSGKALNISLGGILIEISAPLEWEDILQLTIDIEDRWVGIEGKVIYCHGDDFKKYRTGIQFLETNDKIESFVMDLLETYSELLGLE
jgi:c-di-GMP-binding flagellar brake protein YcgR